MLLSTCTSCSGRQHDMRPLLHRLMSYTPDVRDGISTAAQACTLSSARRMKLTPEQVRAMR